MFLNDPGEDPCDDMHEDDIVPAVGETGLGRDAFIVQPVRNDLRGQNSNPVRQEGDERPSPNSEVVGFKVARVFIEIDGPEDREQQDDGAVFAGFPESLEFGGPGGFDADDDPGAVGALHFVRGSEKEGDRDGQTLQDNEDNVGAVSHAAGPFVFDVQRQDDRVADDGTEGAPPDPDVEVSGSFRWFRVSDCDGAFTGPEETG